MRSSRDFRMFHRVRYAPAHNCVPAPPRPPARRVGSASPPLVQAFQWSGAWRNLNGKTVVKLGELALQRGVGAIAFHRHAQMPAIAVGLRFAVHRQGTETAAFGGAQYAS